MMRTQSFKDGKARLAVTWQHLQRICTKHFLTYNSAIFLFSFQYKYTDVSFFGKISEASLGLVSLPLLVFCSSPSRISYSHSSKSITICQTQRVAICLHGSVHKLVSLCSDCPFLICLWNLYKFSSPTQGSPFPIHPDKVHGLVLRSITKLYFLRTPSMGTIFICAMFFFHWTLIMAMQDSH